MSDEPVHLILTQKQCAVVCLGLAGYTAAVFVNNGKDPVTKEPLKLDFIVTIGEVINNINQAMGNPKNTGLEESLKTLRRKMSK